VDGTELARLVADFECELLRLSGEPAHCFNIALTQTNACKRQCRIDLQLGCGELLCKPERFGGVAPCRVGVALPKGQQRNDPPGQVSNSKYR